MTIDARLVGSVMVLDLAGRLGAESAEPLRDRIHSGIFEGHRRFVINMGRVSHVDSTGLGALISCYSSVVKAGGDVVLVSLATRVAEVMAITKLLTVFDVEESEALAIVRLSAHRDVLPSLPRA